MLFRVFYFSTGMNVMKNLVFWLFVCWVGSLFGQEPLEKRIGSLIEKLPAGSEVGIAVYDLTDRKPLYSYRAEKLSRPASTLKLLTSVTALSMTDVQIPFHTDVWYSGEIRGDTLFGDICVVGGFDPEFSDADMDSLVAAVSTLPVKVVTGSVTGDVSLKDSLYWGSGWAWDDTPASFQPYMSTLMFQKGVVKLAVSPSKPGMPAIVQATPRSTYYSISNQTVSHQPDRVTFKCSRDWLNNRNQLVLKGNVSCKSVAEINLYDSPDFFLHTFEERLRLAGIEVLSGYRLAEFKADSNAVKIVSLSCPLQRVLDQTLKESDNLSAEALLWRIGYLSSEKRYVTADDGLKQIRQMIRKVGYNPELYKIADGCGLSNYNYLSPDLLVAFLSYAYNQTDVFRALYKALPIAGIDGTLKHRMRSGKAFRNVHAKTGSFTAVNALAGYLKNESGHWIAFAIMNQNILSAVRARRFQDHVCEVLCGM